MKILILFLGGLSIYSFSNSEQSKRVKAIYGIDNRQDLADVSDPVLKDYALATAAMIDRGKLEQVSTTEYKIVATLLGEKNFLTSGGSSPLCKDERFLSQPQAANCSGFLVSKDLLVTAGHCVSSLSNCNESRWVFDYKVDEQSGRVENVNIDSIYRCKEIVARELTQSSFSPNDYALIRLDREVVGRTPLKFRSSDTAQLGDEVVLIGYPSGLPVKVAAGGVVEKVFDTYFEASIDAFGGNSGSAVINERTGEVEGILVRGRADYSFDFSSSCTRTATFLSNTDSYEGVTHITNIKELEDIEQPVVIVEPVIPDEPVVTTRTVRRCFLFWCWDVEEEI